MKLSINLLPPEPEKQVLKLKQQRVIFYSILILIVFLIINLGIFGFYWLLVRNTAATMAAIENEETQIASLAETEKLYRNLGAKLSFLVSIWQKEIAAEEMIGFSQTLPVADTSISKISFNQEEFMTVGFQAKNSTALENLLDGIVDRAKEGKIKEVKVVSTDRDKDGLFNVSLKFKFLTN